MKRSAVISEITAFLLLVALIGAFLFIRQIRHEEPVIKSITPEIGNPGDILELQGIRFGESRSSTGPVKPLGSSVFIGDRRLVISDYLLWSDEKIRIRLPDDIRSGFVMIENKKGFSNKFLFTSRQEIPVTVEDTVIRGTPYISGLTADSPSIGDEIVIEGKGFGFEQGTGKVFFSLIVPEEKVSGLGIREFTPEFAEYSYVDWSDTAIRLRIPDGAVSGNIYVLTDRGKSNYFYLDMNENQMGKSYVSPAGYEITYDIELFNPGVETDNTLSLWVPHFISRPEQRIIESSSGETPEISGYRDTMLYRFTGEKIGSGLILGNSSIFERYETKTSVTPSRVRRDYRKDSVFYRNYTREEFLIPVEAPEIAIELKKISVNNNPYTTCRNIYNHICRILTKDENWGENDVLASLEKKKGDSYAYSILFTAMARKAGIPARPVAGFYVPEDHKTVRHFWAEFFIPGIGWIPVDPFLGDSKDKSAYYFGNQDSSHIVFSKGIVNLPILNPAGHRMFRDKMYYLQNVYAETLGQDEYLDVDWKDLKILSWW